MLSACTQSTNLPTPAPSTGPAFAVVHQLYERRCGADLCIQVRIQNDGNRAGSGKCQLIGTVQHTSGGDTSIDGPTLLIPTLSLGAATSEATRWSGPVPNGGFRFLCDPPVRE
jgi:hypothetical protein